MPPPSSAPSLPRRVLVALAFSATVGLGLGIAGPAAAQVPTTTTPGVLVPGPSTASTVPPTTAPPTTTAPATDDDGGVLDFDFDANQKVWIIVGALVAVALLLLILTIVYWRHTKPDRSGAVDRGEGRAARKEAKRRRKADDKELSSDAVVDEAPPRDPTSGPLDLDELLGAPDPARSVFGAPDEPGESPR